MASTVVNVSAAYSGTTAAPVEYFDQTGKAKVSGPLLTRGVFSTTKAARSRGRRFTRCNYARIRSLVEAKEARAFSPAPSPKCRLFTACRKRGALGLLCRSYLLLCRNPSSFFHQLRRFQLARLFPNVSGMIAQPEISLDQIGYPSPGPLRRGVDIVRQRVPALRHELQDHFDVKALRDAESVSALASLRFRRRTLRSPMGRRVGEPRKTAQAGDQSVR